MSWNPAITIAIVLTKTENGYAVSVNKDSAITESYVFASFADLSYWLDVQWANPPQVP
jgi:hypothetical protein